MIPIRDENPAARMPGIMWILIGVNVAVFFVQLTAGPAELERMVRLWGLVPAEFTDPAARAEAMPRQYLALFTSMFLHGGIFHILLNLWVLWIFGDNVEDRMGHGRFLVFYFLCGLAAGAVHVAMHPGSTVPTVGASGAISGIMGAYVLMFPLARMLVLIPIIIIPLFVHVPAFVFIGLWFLLQFFSGMQQVAAGAADVGGIAFWAHIGGFVAGLALCPLFLIGRRPDSRTRRRQG